MATTYDEAPRHHEAMQSEKLVITASSLGAVFEWYDFYLYGLLATIISAQFFSGVNETTGFIFALAFIVPQLPKTRSGKILRNLLRKITNGEAFETPATIEDASVPAAIAQVVQASPEPR